MTDVGQGAGIVRLAAQRDHGAGVAAAVAVAAHLGTVLGAPVGAARVAAAVHVAAQLDRLGVAAGLAAARQGG